MARKIARKMTRKWLEKWHLKHVTQYFTYIWCVHSTQFFKVSKWSVPTWLQNIPMRSYGHGATFPFEIPRIILSVHKYEAL